MTTFVGLYRGETVSKAKLIALSADPELVAELAARLLPESPKKPLKTSKQAK